MVVVVVVVVVVGNDGGHKGLNKSMSDAILMMWWD